MGSWWRYLMNYYTMCFLLVFEVTTGKDLHPVLNSVANRWEAWWSQATQRTVRKRSSVLAQTCHVATSKPCEEPSCFPRRQHELCEHSSLYEIGNVTDHFQLRCKEGLHWQCWHGSSPCWHSTMGTPGAAEGYFPGTSWEEPAKSWRHPAFTVRCLRFNRDSWGILYLFLSWKRLMKAIFLSLAKTFLWQLLSFH